jgi:hypothetical protein
MPSLTEALSSLSKQHQSTVRSEVEHLERLFARVKDAEARSSALQQLISELPEPDDDEVIEGLFNLNPWELESGELTNQLRIALTRFGLVKARALVIKLLSAGEEIPAASDLGVAIADLWPNDDDMQWAVSKSAKGKNLLVLLGFLDARQSAGEKSIHQDFLDSEFSKGLDDATRLVVLTSGPISVESWGNSIQLLQQLSVRESVGRIHGWRAHLTDAQIKDLLRLWVDRIHNQDDYNALVDFCGMSVFNQPDRIPKLEDELYEVASLRSTYPATAGQTWDWSQIASAILPAHDEQILEVMLDVVEVGEISGLAGFDDSVILRDSIQRLGLRAWTSIVHRIDNGARGIALVLRGWVTDLISIDDLAAWVDDSLDRARTLASLASVGANEPTPVARYLLTQFPDDDRITSSLAGEFLSGSFVGPESSRLRGQIDQLKNWNRPAESKGVRQWANRITGSLEKQLEAALRREDERGW